MVEDNIGTQGSRYAGEFRDRLPDSLHHLDRVGVASLLEDGQVDGPLAVDPDDVRLDGGSVLHFCHVGHEYLGCSRGTLERDPSDLIHGAELPVRLNRVIGRADHDIASWQNRVGSLKTRDDVHQTELPGLELHRVDVDHDLPVLAAEGLGYRCTGSSGYLVADVELAEVAELRFVKTLTREGDQANR